MTRWQYVQYIIKIRAPLTFEPENSAFAHAQIVSAPLELVMGGCWEPERF